MAHLPLQPATRSIVALGSMRQGENRCTVAEPMTLGLPQRYGTAIEAGHAISATPGVHGLKPRSNQVSKGY